MKGSWRREARFIHATESSVLTRVVYARCEA